MAEFIDLEEKNKLCVNMATNLPVLRAKAGLSQDDLADRLGFSRQTISAIENGKRSMQWSTFTAIALFLSKDEEIKELMIVMGILNNALDEMLSVESKKLQSKTDTED